MRDVLKRLETLEARESAKGGGPDLIFLIDLVPSLGSEPRWAEIGSEVLVRHADEPMSAFADRVKLTAKPAQGVPLVLLHHTEPPN